MARTDDKPAIVKARSWRNVDHVILNRSLFLAGVGALVGLITAGYSLFTAKGTSTLGVPPEDVALVNQQPIARNDFFLQLKALYNLEYRQISPAQRKKVLNQLIREELFVQRGKELDVASVDADVRSAMVAAVEQSLAADAIESRPSEDALRTYYLQNRLAYSSEGWMDLRDVVFPPTSAAAASEALHSGQNIDAVIAQFHGKDSGRVNGQEFFFATKIHLGDTLFDAARVLANGSFSVPLQSSDGVHVIYMIENHAPVPRSFEDARAQVLSDYQKAAITRLLDAGERFLRKRANVLIAHDLR